MKTFLLSFCSLLMVTGYCYAQQTLTHLDENFNISCTTTSGFPALWYQYAVAGTQAWTCTPGRGINNTPCMSMNDYTTMHHADTTWLITPQLDLTGYTKIYFNFFDKYSRNGDSLDVYVTNQYGDGDPLCDSCSWTEIVVPFSQDDTAWREHQIDLTPYKSKPLFVAFKYSSSATAGSIWYIDSVFTTETPTSVGNVIKEHIPVTVLGMPNADGINLECTFPQAGTYMLSLYDITGRVVSAKTIAVNEGTQRMLMNDATLAKGMYFVRLGNEAYSGFAKAVVQ